MPDPGRSWRIVPSQSQSTKGCKYRRGKHPAQSPGSCSLNLWNAGGPVLRQRHSHPELVQHGRRGGRERTGCSTTAEAAGAAHPQSAPAEYGFRVYPCQPAVWRCSCPRAARSSCVAGLSLRGELPCFLWDLRAAASLLASAVMSISWRQMRAVAGSVILHSHGSCSDMMLAAISRRNSRRLANVQACLCSWLGRSKSMQLRAACRLPQGASLISPDDNISLEDFKTQLQTIDKSLRSLPATAQVTPPLLSCNVLCPHSSLRFRSILVLSAVQASGLSGSLDPGRGSLACTLPFGDCSCTRKVSNHGTPSSNSLITSHHR